MTAGSCRDASSGVSVLTWLDGGRSAPAPVWLLATSVLAESLSDGAGVSSDCWACTRRAARRFKPASCELATAEACTLWLLPAEL